MVGPFHEALQRAARAKLKSTMPVPAGVDLVLEPAIPAIREDANDWDSMIAVQKLLLY